MAKRKKFKAKKRNSLFAKIARQSVLAAASKKRKLPVNSGRKLVLFQYNDVKKKKNLNIPKKIRALFDPEALELLESDKSLAGYHFSVKPPAGYMDTVGTRLFPDDLVDGIRAHLPLDSPEKVENSLAAKDLVGRPVGFKVSYTATPPPRPLKEYKDFMNTKEYVDFIGTQTSVARAQAPTTDLDGVKHFIDLFGQDLLLLADAVISNERQRKAFKQFVGRAYDRQINLLYMQLGAPGAQSMFPTLKGAIE